MPGRTSNAIDSTGDADTGGTRSRAALDGALVGGLAWSAAGRWASQIFRWAATIATARILLPADYGIASLAMVIVGLLQYVAEFGIGSAIIQQRSLGEMRVRMIGGASLVIGLVIALVLLLLTPLAVRFFDQPALRLILPVMGVRFLLDALAVVPRSVMTRDMDFRRLSVLEAVESLVLALVTVGVAIATRSYWSFIVANLVSGLVFTALAVRAVPLMPILPRSWAEIHAPMTFGANVVLARLSWYAYSNADVAIVGRVMTEGVLGLYTFAMSIASVPAEKLAGLVLRVAPSILSAAQDTTEMRRYYLALVRGIALVTFPMSAGLGMVSESLIGAVFGAKWSGASQALQFLCFFFGVRSVASLGPVVMVASGEPRVDRNFSAILALVLPPLFLIASRWGIGAVAATWLVAYPVSYGVLGQRWVLNRLALSWAEFLRALWPAVSGSLVMALPVLVVQGLLRGRASDFVSLLAMTLAGATTYGLVLRVFHWGVVTAAVDVVRRRRVS